jgi:lysophospholipid acyltransferase (LPLAT)-like uncharacterized protein
MKNFLLIITAFVIFFIAKLLTLTCKIEIEKNKSVIDFENKNLPAIYAFWHGRMFAAPFLKPNKKIYTIVSRHGDGELIALILRLFGVFSIRGSTNRNKGEHKKGFPAKNRGGAYVIRESIKCLNEGNSIAITPDGPKGPCFKFKSNSLLIAKQTKTPIITLSFSASRFWVFKSWDKFILPKPFSKIKVKFGEVYYFNDENILLDNSFHAEKLDKILNELTTELDGGFR